MNICLVGSSPSSGSTLVADLLDSAKDGTCGPELGLFCASKAYEDYASFKSLPDGRGASRGYYRPYNQVKMHRLPYYGLAEVDFRALVDKAEDLPSLADSIGRRFFALRGKKEGVWFEKTPENVQFASTFLKQFPKGKFIHVVRNPLFVARSLARRGFTPVSALLTWWFEVACVCAEPSERLRTIEYETLTADPFPTMVELFAWAGLDSVEPSELEQNYRQNRYRQITSRRLETWQNREVGGEIVNANKGDIPGEVLFACKRLMKLRISDDWSEKMNVPPVPFGDVLDQFGYLDSVREALAGEDPVAEVKWSSAETREFIFQGLRRLRNGGRSNFAFRLVQAVEAESESTGSAAVAVAE